jgi:hypothetical protein
MDLEAYLQARLEYAVLAPWSKQAKPPKLPASLRRVIAPEES